MRNILLFGATADIGKAIARRLAKEQYHLILVGRTESKLISLREEIFAISKVESKTFVCDLVNPENVDEIFDAIKSEKLKLDGMVYCAGVVENSGIRGIDTKDVENVFRVNYLSYLRACSLFIKKQISNEDSDIVCISSLAAKTCNAGTVGYSCSKEAMNTLNKVLSKECLSRHIRVNSILPGYVKTAMTEALEEEQLLQEQPWGFIQPEEVANFVSFLLSEEVKMLTGAEIVVSGGMMHG